MDVKLPNGTVIQNVPDGITQTELLSMLDKNGVEHGAEPAPKAAPETKDPSSLVDAARSIPGGIAKGVAGVVGLPGDLMALANRGQNYVGNKVVEAFGGKGIPTDGTPSLLPTSGQINNDIQSVTGQYHVPQTTAGKYADTIASFAPTALAPGSLVARAARTVVPAVTSETAGEVTHEIAPSLEPYARLVGAMAGGTVSGIGETMANDIRNYRSVPSTQELKSAANTAYKTSEGAGLIVKGDSFQGMGKGLGDKLAEEGLDASLHPKATAVYNNIVKQAGNITLKGIDILRQQAGDLIGSADRAERRLGYIIKDHIDDYVGNLQPSDVVQGDARGASDAITRARQFWATASKSEIIDNAVRKAGANNGLYSVAGDENALRTQFRKLANNDRAMRRFTPDEQAAITQVATGTKIGNALRYLGKLAPRGVISGAPTYEAFEHGGPIAALGVAAAGEAGKIGARAMTVSAAKRASTLVRSKAPSISQVGTGQLPSKPTPQLTQGNSSLPYVLALQAAAANAQN